MLVLNLIPIFLSFSFMKAKHVPDVLGIYDCDVPKNALQNNLDFQTDYINEKLEVHLKTSFPIDDKVYYNVMVNEYKDGKWKKDIKHFEGQFCESLEIHVPELWKRVVGALKIKKSCPYQPGDYHLKGFPVSQDEFNIPSLPEGRYLAMFTFRRDDQIFGCKQIEMNIS